MVFLCWVLHPPGSTRTDRPFPIATLFRSVNPAVGLRAIRLSLRGPRLLRPQLAAMLRAGAHGPLRILLPMITTPGEVRAVRKELEKTARRLVRRGLRIADPLPPVGVMIDVPGAAQIGRASCRERGCSYG